MTAPPRPTCHRSRWASPLQRRPACADANHLGRLGEVRGSRPAGGAGQGAAGGAGGGQQQQGCGRERREGGGSSMCSALPREYCRGQSSECGRAEWAVAACVRVCVWEGHGSTATGRSLLAVVPPPLRPVKVRCCVVQDFAAAYGQRPAQACGTRMAGCYRMARLWRGWHFLYILVKSACECARERAACTTLPAGSGTQKWRQPSWQWMSGLMMT